MISISALIIAIEIILLLFSVANRGKELHILRNEIYQRVVHGERGSGFGLPLSRDIMEAHGGDLTVESKAGEGSVFSARLPYIRPRILVVDDSISRSMIMELLREDDVEVMEAENGKEALELLNKNVPRLIIFELMTPVMDGFEFLGHLKKDLETQHVPMIAMASDGKSETRLK